MELGRYLFLSIFFTLASTYSNDTCDTVPNILTRHGYLYENHTVITHDGFHLTLFRIVSRSDKPPILMQSGQFSSANTFVGNGKSSAAFYLANRGYEVWLASARGTQYSRKHEKYRPDMEEYWDFSFEELGTIDGKTCIEYVKSVTGKKVIYFGTSQGFMQLIAAFSLDPEFFQQHLKKIIGWAAVVRIDLAAHLPMVLTRYLKVWPLVTRLGITHAGDFDRDSCLAEAKLCDDYRFLCRLKSMLVEDFIPYSRNFVTQYGGDASSMKAFQHMAYNVYEEGFFRHPSRGERVEYELKNVTGVPIGICIGEGDLLATPGNAWWLKSKLKDNLKIIGIYKELGHKTFLASFTHFQHYTDTYKFLEEE
eukprot:TRINITY_DN13093_c0_g2_i2.p1 TRINITY_DN13093_c0_g2~~TRINITY_DN13093_c0_g2_i2.p1  ORF type:complete len:365 (+),score=73.25 TRINITY_DN13093_c0_g2_i2:84-1178(+)